MDVSEILLVVDQKHHGEFLQIYMLIPATVANPAQSNYRTAGGLKLSYVSTIYLTFRDRQIKYKQTRGTK